MTNISKTQTTRRTFLLGAFGAALTATPAFARTVGKVENTGPATPGSLQAGALRDIVGVRWKHDPNNGSGPFFSIEFREDGSVGGYDGCNSFGGSYKVTECGIRFIKIIASRRYCGGRLKNFPGLRSMWSKARRFERQEKSLSLYDSEGALLGVFLATPAHRS